MLTFRDSEDALHAAARDATGLNDFGDDRYLEALRVLLASLDDDTRLTPLGNLATRAMIIDALKGRLHSEAGFARHPKCTEAPVERPLVIIGLARTGTSALHHLLACDPGHQGLELWLAQAPRRRPPRSRWPEDPDYRASDERMRALYERSPEMAAIHQMAAGQVDECWYLLAQDFMHSSWEANTSPATYARWWAAQEMTPSYLRHRHNLQLIGHAERHRRWLLKDSTHLFDLGAFLAVYPDAMIVQTHRDPASVIPSTCNLCWTGYQLFNEEPDPVAFGRSALALWGRAIDATMAVRAEHDPAQFYDLQFEDFRREPIASVRRIYDHFGLELSAEALTAMLAFSAANPEGRHGRHDYAIGDWGLDADSVRERFGAYIDCYDVPTPAA